LEPGQRFVPEGFAFGIPPIEADFAEIREDAWFDALFGVELRHDLPMPRILRPLLRLWNHVSRVLIAALPIDQRREIVSFFCYAFAFARHFGLQMFFRWMFSFQSPEQNLIVPECLCFALVMVYFGIAVYDIRTEIQRPRERLFPARQ
jgi:hypothetical protein